VYVDSLLSAGRYDLAKAQITQTEFDNINERFLYFGKIYSTQRVLDSAFYYLLKTDTLALSTAQKATYYKYMAETFAANNEEDEAFNYFRRAQQFYEATENKRAANQMNYELYTTLSGQEHINFNKEDYLLAFEETAKTNSYNDQLADAYVEHAMNFYDAGDKDRGDAFINKAITTSTSSIARARIETIKGLYLAEVYGKLDSADYYYDRVLQVQKDQNLPDPLFYTYINKASVFKHRDQYGAAIDLLKKADSLPIRSFRKNNKKILYKNLADTYEVNGDSLSALKYLKLHLIYSDSVDIQAQNVNLTRYQTQQREKELLISEQKKKQTQQIATGLGAGLAAVAVIGVLVYKNTRRKQRIAEQQREIEIQKKEKLLKEQELTTIDAMIAGQEKERQRIASDLHDSVGATLAAAKLQFNHLHSQRHKIDNEEELFLKTRTLLDDAYKEIRSMAHLKNSGVIAKKGLLPAVQKLAENASVAGNLTIEVQDFGLDERLDNMLEIAIFRMLQELVTNIIKHANASEASISITQHDDILNIIVEDNGRGFNASNIQAKEGIGLSSIERRIEHMEGTMEVDSTPNKGTTILIDIPL
jgi:two-component system sensor histidine kinase DegS